MSHRKELNERVPVSTNQLNIDICNILDTLHRCVSRSQCWIPCQVYSVREAINNEIFHDGRTSVLLRLGADDETVKLALMMSQHTSTN